MAWVIVARERDEGDIMVGTFLVDTWCLGVKDAYVQELDRAELDEWLNEQIPAEQREAMAPADAKALIEGGMAFAHSLGFLPHRDFRKARKALNGIDATAATRTFDFGQDGRVHFVAGPNDDETRVNRVLAVLHARFGSKGYDFTPYVDVDDEDEFYEDALDMMFRYFDSAQSPEHVRNGFQVSGFLAAAVTLECDGETAGWWQALFGGEVPELPENDEFDGETIHIGFIEEWLLTKYEFARGRFDPAMPGVDEPPGDHFEIAADYCRGFLLALEARPEQSARLEQDAQASEALATLRRYAAGTADGPSATARRSAAPVIGAALRTLWGVAKSWRESAG